MALLERIQTDMVAAMRAKDEARLNAIRLIKTALKKHEVDSMKPLDEATELQILSTLIKQRREAAEMFRKGDRPELADKEEAELKLVESYMPAAPSRSRDRRRHHSRAGGDRRDVGEADGRGDESDASEAGGQARGRESAEREGAGTVELARRMSFQNKEFLLETCRSRWVRFVIFACRPQGAFPRCLRLLNDAVLVSVALRVNKARRFQEGSG